MARKLWESDARYRALKAYTDFCTRLGYSKLEYAGRENIPADGAVIFAANHCNTLMDAMVVLASRRDATAFGARADLFKKKKLGDFLRFLRIVPLARERDGAKAVTGNYAVMDEVVKCLSHDVPFCLYPEGTHRPKRSLMPFKKGVVRIAWRAVEALDKPVYIVPTGIEYGDYYLASTPCRVTFGEPICINEVIGSNPDKTEPELYHVVLAMLHERISGLITFFPDDENLDAACAEFEASKLPKLGVAGKAAGVLLALPLAVVLLALGIFSFPFLIMEYLLCRRLKDLAWTNTMRFAARVVFTIPHTILVAALSFCFLPVPAAAALTLFTPLAYPLYHFVRNYFVKLKACLKR